MILGTNNLCFVFCSVQFNFRSIQICK